MSETRVDFLDGLDASINISDNKMMDETLKKLIMIVEDDDSIRNDLGLILEMEGYEVCTAANGQEGLNVLKETKKVPSLIILDIMMPVMDGWTFRTEQLKLEGAANVPVIVMTADGHASEKATKMNAHGFIQKPIHSLDSFLETIVRFCKPAS